MDYKEFKERFMEAVKEAYTETSGREVRAFADTIHKMNESYEAIVITPEGSSMGLNLRVDNFYEAFENGTPYNEVVKKAVEVIEGHIDFVPDVAISDFTNYEKMKETLAIEVVSAERNAEKLSEVPHQMMEDMAVIYRFVVSSGETGRGTILVTNKLLESMDVTPEQLHEDAMKIAPELKPAMIQGMSEVMKEMMGESATELFGDEEFPADEIMYVASVPDKVHGAGVIAYPGFMDQATEKLGGDFFVLPSSLHEIILVKDDGNTDYRTFQEMVETINAEQVSLEEQLTDNVYHYDSQDKVFELAEKFEARKQEREAVSLEKGEKGSVLKNLKDKQNIVDKAISSIDASIKTPKLKEGAVL